MPLTLLLLFDDSFYIASPLSIIMSLRSYRTKKGYIKTTEIAACHIFVVLRGCHINSARLPKY